MSKEMELETENSLNDQLISSNTQEVIEEPLSAMTRFKEYFWKEVQTRKRKVHLSGEVSPKNNQNNLVKNTKYNLLTFVPKVLYNQFKFFYNMFFLINALTQLVEILRVGLFITYIGPLIMVLSLTMAKEAYDDFNTYKRDIEVNR
jgi:phospholipid-translocating ATPase